MLVMDTPVGLRDESTLISRLVGVEGTMEPEGVTTKQESLWVKDWMSCGDEIVVKPPLQDCAKPLPANEIEITAMRLRNR